MGLDEQDARNPHDDGDEVNSDVPIEDGQPAGGPFEFEAHGARAMADYQRVHGLYRDFAGAVDSILRTCLTAENIAVHSIEHRAKSIESLGRKASKASDDNPTSPKYEFPLSQITDLAGARVITFFLSTVDRIDPIIAAQFDMLERTNRSQLLEQEEKLGYHSIHYIVKFKMEQVGVA